MCSGSLHVDALLARLFADFGREHGGLVADEAELFSKAGGGSISESDGGTLGRGGGTHEGGNPGGLGRAGGNYDGSSSAARAPTEGDESDAEQHKARRRVALLHHLAHRLVDFEFTSKVLEDVVVGLVDDSGEACGAMKIDIGLFAQVTIGFSRAVVRTYETSYNIQRSSTLLSVYHHARGGPRIMTRTMLLCYRSSCHDIDICDRLYCDFTKCQLYGAPVLYSLYASCW